MNLVNNWQNLYLKSDKKFFKVVYIAKSEDEANEYMTNNKETSVINEDEESGLIFIAENKETKF